MAIYAYRLPGGYASRYFDGTKSAILAYLKSRYGAHYTQLLLIKPKKVTEALAISEKRKELLSKKKEITKRISADSKKVKDLEASIKALGSVPPKAKKK